MTLSNRSSASTINSSGTEQIDNEVIDIEENQIMKWEYNEPHTTNLHSPVEYNVIYTHHQDRQCLFVLELHSDMFLSHIN